MGDQTKEYIFVNLIDKQPPEAKPGKVIPLHMTALHWFATERDVGDIIKSAEVALGDIGKIATTATQESLFGPEHDIPVTQLERTEGLLRLHTNLIWAMRNLGAQFDERWTGEKNWNPHVTHKPNRRMNPGDSLLIDDIDLIYRNGENGIRRIIHHFELDT